jgi:hypothetical protein
LHKRQLEPGTIINTRANQARWRLSGLDPDTISSNDTVNPRRRVIEERWAEAARANTQARVAVNKAEIAALWAQRTVLEYTTGEEDAFEDQLRHLREEGARIQSPSRDSNPYFTPFEGNSSR